MNAVLTLASTSSRRRELLVRLGFTFQVLAPEVDETPGAGESAKALAARLAEAKARAGAGRAAGAVLAADTVVVADGCILGKPDDAAGAEAMLATLSGAEHQVITALALLHGATLMRAAAVTRVWFRRLDAQEIARYASSDETPDAAGAYAVQGGGAPFVTRLVGSYSNVVGLPLAETARLLRDAGLAR